MTPTVGARARYWPMRHERVIHELVPQPLAAIIVHVWTDRSVNLVIWREDGTQFSRSHVFIAELGEGQSSQCELCP